MRCGVLCDKNGAVKRTWALISDTAIVSVEDGDEVMEWDVDHGENLPHTEEKLAKTQEAVKEQERVPTLRTRDAVLAHGTKKSRDIVAQRVVLAMPPSEPIYYSAEKKLHHRMVDIDGNVQERIADTSCRLSSMKGSRNPNG